jgi:hypothetical protein
MAREYKDDETLEQMLLSKRDFRDRIEPIVRKSIKGMIEEVDKEWALERRKEYLVTTIADFRRWLAWKSLQYVCTFEANQILWGRYLLNEIKLAKECLADLTRELKYLRVPEDRKGGNMEITDDMIQRAREYPFEQLATFNRAGFTICPFHQEKTGSMHLNKEKNFVYCHGSCKKAWDTIGFVMDSQGIGFVQAVRVLQ